MIHVPLWMEVVLFVPLTILAIWQERRELVRLWRELRTGERID